MAACRIPPIAGVLLLATLTAQAQPPQEPRPATPGPPPHDPAAGVDMPFPGGQPPDGFPGPPQRVDLPVPEPRRAALYAVGGVEMPVEELVKRLQVFQNTRCVALGPHLSAVGPPAELAAIAHLLAAQAGHPVPTYALEIEIGFQEGEGLPIVPFFKPRLAGRHASLMELHIGGDDGKGVHFSVWCQHVGEQGPTVQFSMKANLDGNTEVAVETTTALRWDETVTLAQTAVGEGKLAAVRVSAKRLP